jgi:hypothetical protein
MLLRTFCTAVRNSATTRQVKAAAEEIIVRLTAQLFRQTLQDVLAHLAYHRIRGIKDVAQVVLHCLAE